MYFIDLIIIPNLISSKLTALDSTLSEKENQRGEEKKKNRIKDKQEDEGRTNVKIKNLRKVRMEFIGMESEVHFKIEKSKDFC